MRILLKVVMIGLVLAVQGAAIIWLDGRAKAASLPTYPQAPKTQTLDLPPKTKLVGGIAWHCFSAAPCEPWYTTRAMRPGEAAETYDFTNLDGRKIEVRERTE